MDARDIQDKQATTAPGPILRRGVTPAGHARADRLIGIDGWRLLWFILIVQLGFAIWPQADLIVSGWFFDDGFAAEGTPAVETLRMAAWYLSIALFLLSLLALVIAAFGWYVADVPAKVWAFVALVFLLGPGILVNGILKEFWGRARPSTVEAFGGDLEFTPPFQLSDQCASNCSFVSGEVSGTAATAIAMVVLARLVLRDGASRVVAAAAALLCLLVMVLRISAGRHFLSDTIFAVLLTLGLAVLVDRALYRIWRTRAVPA